MSGAFWTPDRVTSALNGELNGARPCGATALGSIATDTRTIRAGDVFLALIGERFDGHDFLAQAVELGAAAVVIARPERCAGLGVPVFAVKDTLLALGALARFRRRSWGGTVIGVAGSNGKTTTKELLRAAIGSVLDVHATEANLNNRVGVPLTLLALRDEADVAVVELGTNLPGEVALLRGIAEPDIAVVTSIAEEHLEGLGDMAGVLREESASCEGASVAIVPADEAGLIAAARARARRVVTAGLDEGQVRPTRWVIGDGGLGSLEMDAVPISLPLRGRHNLRNAMLALACARECSVGIPDAARGIAKMPAPRMRLGWESLGGRGATLINDAYNANPGSTRAALELLESVGAGRQRVAVLGTMRELGQHAERLHDDIARTVLRSSIDVIAGIGDFAAPLAAAGDMRVITAPDVDQLWPLLSGRLSQDPVILLKASRGVRLERLVPRLQEWAT
ncbi:MAG: UDP-N-acetylmuramoyl-tripeptide--D-alanyl-D-alanine ligase [Gemmatimonadaceae bacterium]